MALHVLREADPAREPAPRRAAAVALLALACAGPQPAPAATRGTLDCAEVREQTVRACVDGFASDASALDEEDLAVRFALEAACPYAGAIAWSGCERGAFERFEGRSALGWCGDLGDYIETSIELSCMRRREDLALEVWNALVKRCFDWAIAGSAGLRALCLVDRVPHRGL